MSGESDKCSAKNHFQSFIFGIFAEWLNKSRLFLEQIKQFFIVKKRNFTMMTSRLTTFGVGSCPHRCAAFLPAHGASRARTSRVRPGPGLVPETTLGGH
jgi:hypothetical protein